MVAIGTELGGAGTITRQTLAVARRGVRNMLCHFGLIEGQIEGEPSRITEVSGPEYYVHAPCRGLFEPAFDLGDIVSAGQRGGLIHFMDDPARAPVEVRF